MVEMASTEASLRLLLCNLRIYMSILLRKIWTMRFRLPKKIDPNRKRFRPILVEMAVIETASENQFPRISTSVVYLLRFPSRNADKQAFLYGIL